MSLEAGSVRVLPAGLCVRGKSLAVTRGGHLPTGTLRNTQGWRSDLLPDLLGPRGLPEGTSQHRVTSPSPPYLRPGPPDSPHLWPHERESVGSLPAALVSGPPLGLQSCRLGDQPLLLFMERNRSSIPRQFPDPSVVSVVGGIAYVPATCSLSCSPAGFQHITGFTTSVSHAPRF